MESALTPISGALCGYCYHFIKEFSAFEFTCKGILPEWWRPFCRQSTSRIPFRHHETFADLAASAVTCELCNVLHDSFAPLPASKHQGVLLLYPFQVSPGDENKLKGHFHADFSDSMKRHFGFRSVKDLPPGYFRVCKRTPLRRDEQVPRMDAYKKLPVVPTSLLPSDISRVAFRWHQECIENHPDCIGSHLSCELPTRVIDVGDHETGTVRLYTSKGEKAPYTALSHCWGGSIASVTTTANVRTMNSAIIINDLPRNFRDAIWVTRALGLRYLWVDALCIIQNSKVDRDREVSRMSSIYAGASVIISALDAATSTAGFLSPTRAPFAVINDEYAIQKVYPEITDYLVNTPLNDRGWAMQERLLGQRILHFGKEQMFWECLTEFKCEDGTTYTSEPEKQREHFVAQFMRIRKEIGVSAIRGTELDWKVWYQLLEEYTSRKLTHPADKLPAIAGAATLFKSTKRTATYVAGLWKEDIVAGLLWYANCYEVPGRKIWRDPRFSRLSVLTEPLEKRAPSWSWAALDGPLDFWTLRLEETRLVPKVSDVTIDVKETAHRSLDATIKLKGYVAQMTYNPPEDPHWGPGKLVFIGADPSDENPQCIERCIMDIDRPSSQNCWVVLMAEAHDVRLLLVLDKRYDGAYQRIGTAMMDWADFNPERFEMQQICIA